MTGSVLACKAEMLVSGNLMVLDLAGDDESVIEGASSCLGEYSRFCTADAFSDLLQEGPLVQSTGPVPQQLAAALTLASISSRSPARSTSILLLDLFLSS